MNKFFLLSILVTLISGCLRWSRESLDVSVGDCDQPGEVISDVLNEPARGYPYHFQVYLPPCYPGNPLSGYPVLFLLPGRSGSPKVWFTSKVNEIVDEMILGGLAPPFLIIATNNTDADSYGKMLIKELVPYIRERYRVSGDRRYWGVAGGSLGGITAYRMVFQNPDLFSSLGVFGSGVNYGEEAILRDWVQKVPPEQPVRIFLNCGEQDPLMLDRAKILSDILEGADIETATLFSSGDHSYNYWVSNFPQFVTWLVQSWGVNAGAGDH